jgi:hypothetical protein
LIKEINVLRKKVLIMTVKRIKKHHDCLRFLAKANPKLRSSVINAADKDLVCCICECIQNVIKGHVPIPYDSTKKLKPYRNTMEAIVNKRTNVYKKKQLLNQSGGFLPILLAPLLGVIGSLVGESISKNGS